MSRLFRSEALEARGQRLLGDVLLVQPLSSWILTGLLAVVVLTLSLWVTLGQYARTETAPGRIIPDGPLTRLYAARPGVVTKFYVKEGDIVRPGQPLAQVRIEQSTSDRAAPITETLTTFDDRAALVQSQIQMQVQQSAAEHTRLTQQIGLLRSELASLDEQITLQHTIVDSAKLSFDQLAALVEKGYASKIEFERRRQAYLGQEQQLRQLRQQRASLEERLAQSRADLARVPLDAATRTADLRTNLATLKQQRIGAEGERAYVIAAPVAGRVTAVQTATGRFVTSQLPLMTIVPTQARMEAELYAPSRAIGFARIGQEVRLLYDAFPYQRFGSFQGRITAISRTVLAPNEIDAPLETREPVYRIRVALEAQDVKAYGQTIPLQPGMTLTANIVLDRRSFLDWLLEPLNAVRNRT